MRQVEVSPDLSSASPSFALHWRVSASFVYADIVGLLLRRFAEVLKEVCCGMVLTYSRVHRREPGNWVLLDCEVNRILLKSTQAKVLSLPKPLGPLCAPLLGKLVYHTEESFATTGTCVLFVS